MRHYGYKLHQSTTGLNIFSDLPLHCMLFFLAKSNDEMAFEHMYIVIRRNWMHFSKSIISSFQNPINMLCIAQITFICILDNSAEHSSAVSIPWRKYCCLGKCASILQLNNQFYNCKSWKACLAVSFFLLLALRD